MAAEVCFIIDKSKENGILIVSDKVLECRKLEVDTSYQMAQTARRNGDEEKYQIYMENIMNTNKEYLK